MKNLLKAIGFFLLSVIAVMIIIFLMYLASITLPLWAAAASVAAIPAIIIIRAIKLALDDNDRFKKSIERNI